MKRSHWVRLALMGASPFALVACEDPKTEALLYQSVEQCISNSEIPAETCREQYLAALQNHQQIAPRYTNVANCETDFGANGCQKVSSGIGDYFIPAMAGFMIAQAMNQNDRHSDHYYGYYGGGGYNSQPLYRTRDDRSAWRTSSNTVLAGTGKTTVRTQDVTPQKKAITMSRSGFGSTSAARGSWGGGS